MRYGIKDRIVDMARNLAEKLSLSKETLIHIGLAILLAVGISAGIAVGVSPNTDELNNDIDALGQTDDYILTTIDALLNQDAVATSAIGGINSTVHGQVASIDDLTLLLNGLQVDLDNLICSPPDSYLDGTFGDYTLYVKSNKAGEFTANVYMVYSPPLSAGNATNYTAAVEYFYAGINWTLANHLYIPTISFNGTAWVICQVSFNIGAFILEAHTEATIEIQVEGFDYTPTVVYIEIYETL